MTKPTLADALFRPRSVALVGAGDTPGKNNSRVHEYLRKHGYDGDIFPVNPTRDELYGVRCYHRVRDITAPVDQVLIMTPPRSVPEIIQDCAEIGASIATIFTANFAETGDDGRALQDEIVGIARAGGVRLIGPNCIGIIGVKPSLALTANTIMELPELPQGGYSVISQSGSLLGTFLSRGGDRGIGFAKLVSIGNECDLTVAEVAETMVDDPDTEAILLFLETIRDADRMAEMAHRAHAAGKPVIAYKLGRSEAANAVAASHTGSITGSNDAVDAFFQTNGIVRVENFEALYEMPPLVMDRKPKPGTRASVITTTGGGGAMVVDNLSLLGIECRPFSDESMARLDSNFGIRPQNGPLIDTTFGNANSEAIGAVLDEAIAAEDTDIVIFAVGSSARSNPDLTVRPLVARKGQGKPLCAFLVPEGDDAYALLAAAGIAAFGTPEACADGVRAALTWRAPTPIPDNQSPPQDVVNALNAGRGTTLDERESRAVFEALGIPHAAMRYVIHSEDAAKNAAEIGYPVAVKVVSSDLPHKTEAGGVILGVEDGVGVNAATESIRRRVGVENPNATIEGFLLQRMESGLAEVLLGYRVDSLIGPTVVLGMGGILAEIYKDAALRLAPVSLEGAREMIDEVSGLAVIRGYRNLPTGDLDGLAKAIVAISQLGLVKDVKITEAEINPLIVKHDAVVAVDGLIILEEPESVV